MLPVGGYWEGGGGLIKRSYFQDELRRDCRDDGDKTEKGTSQVITRLRRKDY
jgi:hypothetical protein